jgi:hypothetical protein
MGIMDRSPGAPGLGAPEQDIDISRATPAAARAADRRHDRHAKFIAFSPCSESTVLFVVRGSSTAERLFTA